MVSETERSNGLTVQRSGDSLVRTGDSANQFLDLCSLALRFMPGVGVPAVNALLTKPGAAPDQVVHGALEFLDAIGEVGRRGRRISHGRKVVPAGLVSYRLPTTVAEY